MKYFARAAAAFVLLPSLTACSSSPYEGRNGEAEALSDIAAKTPLKLYFHEFNGYVPTIKVPGLTACEPDGLNRSKVFVRLEGADWQEGEDYSAREEQHPKTAWRFASAYNRAIFRARGKDVQAVCRQARVG